MLIPEVIGQIFLIGSETKVCEVTFEANARVDFVLLTKTDKNGGWISDGQKPTHGQRLLPVLQKFPDS